MKIKHIFAIVCSFVMLTSVSLAIYKVVLEHGTHNSDLLKRNLELLLEKE